MRRVSGSCVVVVVKVVPKMAELKKRRVEDEKRQFKLKWEESYFFVEHNGKPQCVICSQVLGVSKEYNVSRHYTSLHKSKYDKYQGSARSFLFNNLKLKLTRQKNIFQQPSNTAGLKASYEVCLELAKSKKSFRDGELIKRCAVKMASSFGDCKMAKHFETVPLSHQTVSRRISDMAGDVLDSLKGIIEKCEFYSLALDESTDIADISQILIFVRTINKEFEIHEELLELKSLETSTKGIDIYNALNDVVSKYGGFEKCSGIATDGAKAMVGHKTGLVGLCKGKGLNCLFFHCIIHQEALCGKIIRLSETMKTVVNIVNLIRGGNKAHRHRAFIAFLDNVDAEYGDISLYCEVRWLSAGNCLQQFFGLRNEILAFLTNENIGHEYQEKLKDLEFLNILAFLTDLTSHLNTLNLKLQGRKQNISQLYGHVEGFRKKLEVMQIALKENNTAHFPSCQQLKERNDTNFSMFHEIIIDIKKQFQDRFQDFDSLKPKLALLNNPMNIEVSEVPCDLQMEVCDLQADPFYQTQKCDDPENFWKLISKERFPKLLKFALQMLSLFGSTYVCESAFSALKQIKSKSRNRIESVSLESTLRLCLTEFTVDIDKLVSAKQCQSSY